MNWNSISTNNLTSQNNSALNPIANNSSKSSTTEILIQPSLIFLEDFSIPESNFMQVYSTNPFVITSGHISAKLPCSEDNLPSVNVLVGKMPNYKNAALEYISPLSTPGELCNYQFQIHPNSKDPISEILLQNNSTDDIDFPATTNIIVGVTKVVQPNNQTGSANDNS